LNTNGRLGDGTKTDRPAPVQPAGVRDVTGFAVASDHALALLDDGTVMIWGAHVAAGIGSHADAPKPMPVPGLRDVVEVGAAGSDSCARTKDGSLWCWGVNDHGQIGDGTRKDRWLPTKVRGQSGVVGFRVAPDHTCAWHADGSVACWGNDSRGAAGCGGVHTVKGVDNDTQNGPMFMVLDCLQPTVVAGIAHVSRIETTLRTTLALLGSGATWTWGNTPVEGDAIPVRSPADGPVGHDSFHRSDVVDLAVGGQVACVVTAAGQVYCDDGGNVAVGW
jgi:alpha-tubulin suppressor-like RCC1 family protein